MLVSDDLPEKTILGKISGGRGSGGLPPVNKKRTDSIESVPSRDDRIRTDDLFNVTEALYTS